MESTTPQQLLNLAFFQISPHMKPDAEKNTLVITGGKLRMIPQGSDSKGVIVIMHISKQMLRKGFSSTEWDTLQKNMIKHQKEITD